MCMIDGQVGSMLKVIHDRQVDDDTQYAGAKEIPEIDRNQKQEYFCKTEFP